jgi:hypothetical protein
MHFEELLGLISQRLLSFYLLVVEPLFVYVLA